MKSAFKDPSRFGSIRPHQFGLIRLQFGCSHFSLFFELGRPQIRRPAPNTLIASCTKKPNSGCCSGRKRRELWRRQEWVADGPWGLGSHPLIFLEK